MLFEYDDEMLDWVMMLWNWPYLLIMVVILGYDVECPKSGRDYFMLQYWLLGVVQMHMWFVVM